MHSETNDLSSTAPGAPEAAGDDREVSGYATVAEEMAYRRTVAAYANYAQLLGNILRSLDQTQKATLGNVR